MEAPKMIKKHLWRCEGIMGTIEARERAIEIPPAERTPRALRSACTTVAAVVEYPLETLSPLDSPKM